MNTKTFQDTQGRLWAVSITVRDAKRLRDLLGLNLYGLAENGFVGLGELLADPVQLVDVLYVLCKDQADERKLSDEEFGRAFAGDTIEAGAHAFLEAFTDFFPNPQRRDAIRKLLTTSETLGSRLMDRASSQLDDLDVDSLLDQLIASSGTSPASSVSTQTPSPSANST